jgi:hypothetical protein
VQKNKNIKIGVNYERGTEEAEALMRISFF